MKARIDELEVANAAMKKRKSRKRTRVQAGGTLTVEEGRELAATKARPAKAQRLQGSQRDDAEGSAPRQRLCSNCGKAGHNSRTCQVVDINDSNSIEA